MPATAMTLRMDSALKDQLASLGKLRHMTMNKLINQALVQYVTKETLVAQGELEASLEELKRYRAADPDFEQAIEQVAMAECLTGHDPAQGVVTMSESYETTRLVRSLLDV